MAGVAGALLAACGPARPATATRTHAPPPFLAVAEQRIALPASVQPWGLSFTPDGRHLLFEDQLDGYQVWVVGTDGTGLHCVTCGMADAPHVTGDVGAFVEAFPDDRRILVSQDTALPPSDPPAAPDAWVVSCAPSIDDCASRQAEPVDLSADRVGPEPLLMRRTWHLAPDGTHLGWTDVRPDGTMVVVASLRQQAGRYVAADPRVIDPPVPRSPADTDATRWADAGQIWELKSFARGGRDALLVGQPDGINPDQVLVDLRTGRVTRLTAAVDWDEDGALSPDGALDLVASFRGMHRTDLFGTLPGLRPLVEAPVIAGLAGYYVSTHAGFQCTLTPWLLPGAGDDGGRLMGQPLEAYRSGPIIVSSDLMGAPIWSPDGTTVVLQQVVQGPPQGSGQQATMGTVPSQILLADLHRRPARPVAVVPSTVGAWAPTPARWTTPLGHGASATITGPGGGEAALSMHGTLLSGSATLTYHHWSVDGRTFVDGSEAVDYPSYVGKPVAWRLDVRVSGANQGTEHVALLLDGPATAGTVTTVLDGVRRSGLPPLGACPSSLPRPPQLRAAASVTSAGGGRRVVVRVTASVRGAGRLQQGVDTRAVDGAVVRAGGRRAVTGADGRATLDLPAGTGQVPVTVDAGPTFEGTTVTAR